jgi:ATP-dependent Clp protease ATP-binding subunit ClpA
MFKRFSDPARAVLIEAEDLAKELGSPYLGAGHLLYGCAEGREPTAGRPLHDAGITGPVIRRALPRLEEAAPRQLDPDALRAIGIDYEGVQSAVEQTFGAGALESAPDRRAPSGRIRKPRFTPDAKRSLELSLRVAQELHDKRIEPGHLLLGILRLDNDLVSSVIEKSETDVATLSAGVLTQLTKG